MLLQDALIEKLQDTKENALSIEQIIENLNLRFPPGDKRS
jgi:hypothetical protein